MRGERSENFRQVPHNRAKVLAPGERHFVHVEAAIDLDLDRVEVVGRVAVMFGDVPAGIGLVAENRIAEGAQLVFGPVDEIVAQLVP